MPLKKYRELRSEGFKAWLASLGPARIELLRDDCPAVTDTTAWADVADYRANFPGYRAATMDPEEMIGPTFVDPAYKLSSLPLLFQQSGDGTGPVTCDRAALVVRIGPVGEWTDFLLDVATIVPGALVFENDGDVKAYRYQIATNECSADDGGGDGDDDDAPALAVDETIDFTSDGDDTMTYED